MVVLDDEKSSKRVPAVSGLLAYRKDIQSLHVRMNDSWKTLPVEEKVHKIICMMYNDTFLKKSLLDVEIDF